MFLGRRLLVVSVLKLTCNLAVPMHKEHKIEKYTIILIMGQQSWSKKSVWAGGVRNSNCGLTCHRLCLIMIHIHDAILGSK